MAIKLTGRQEEALEVLVKYAVSQNKSHSVVCFRSREETYKHLAITTEREAYRCKNTFNSLIKKGLFIETETDVIFDLEKVRSVAPAAAKNAEDVMKWNSILPKSSLKPATRSAVRRSVTAQAAQAEANAQRRSRLGIVGDDDVDDNEGAIPDKEEVDDENDEPDDVDDDDDDDEEEESDEETDASEDEDADDDEPDEEAEEEADEPDEEEPDEPEEEIEEEPEEEIEEVRVASTTTKKKKAKKPRVPKEGDDFEAVFKLYGENIDLARACIRKGDRERAIHCLIDASECLDHAALRKFRDIVRINEGFRSLVALVGIL